MLGRILLLGTVATSLSACSILTPFEGKTTREGYFPTKNVADQDPYMRRFYELEQEIQRLKASNARLEHQVALQPTVESGVTAPAESVAVEPSPVETVSTVSPIDHVLNEVRSRADSAIAAIDRALASLAGAGNRQPPADSLLADAAPASIQAEREPVSETEAVQAATYSDSSRPAYNYSVVYVYRESALWDAMWSKLEESSETDKWRGFNAERSSYFIYVGAYYNEADAQKRQEALFALVGERPVMRERVQNQAIASK